jgi:hypothetical protein
MRWKRHSRLGVAATMAATFVVAASPAPAQESPAREPACGFHRAFVRQDEDGLGKIWVYEGAPSSAIGGTRPLAFVSPLKVNTDGTRISYKVDDPRAVNGAINDIRYAFNDPNRPISDFEAIAAANWKPVAQVWRVLDPEIIERDRRPGKQGRPCIDADNYIVSMTAEPAVAGGGNREGDCDQTKWIDALTVPGIVLPTPTRSHPSEFNQRGALMRSVAVAMTLAEPRRIAFGIVGDLGPDNKLGEASVAMNRTLNGLASSDNPKSGDDADARFQASASIVFVLPGEENRLPYPVTGERASAFAKVRFDAWGGESRLQACLAEIAEAHE